MHIRFYCIALTLILTATAVHAQLAWRPALPAARRSHAMAYDSTRGVPVIFGGWTSDVNGETWTWNGSTWIARQVVGPHARTGHAMAFDSVRRTVVMNGGTWGITNGETWSWNGTSWTSNGTNGPSARYGHAMSFDTTRGVMVLFGGYGDGLYQDDTWEWTGIWTRRVVTGPSGRTNHCMAYDNVRRVTLLLGAPNNGTTNELWAWNGTVWTMLASGGPPLTSVPWKMAFDTVRGVAVACGGAIDAPLQTWEWNGSQWTQRLTPGPTTRYSSAIAYDAARQVTIMYGGSNGTNRVTGETWEWDGANWMLRGATPPDVSGMMMSFDTARNRAVVFGGEYYTSTPGTWEWDGVTWWKSSPSGPVGRSNPALVFDEFRNKTLLFGGYSTVSGEGSSGNLFDTWEWDGSAWTQRNVSGPSPRAGAKLAYDAARHVVVLFGGIYYANTTYLGDTWEWNGAAWVNRGITGPTARTGHAMTFDIARNVTVLFGGVNATGYRNDTWEWDGIQWTPRFVTGPSARAYAGMTFHRTRQASTLFGGSNGSSIFSDLWEWNGSSWTMSTAVGPTNRDNPAMAYDLLRDDVVMLSGVVVTVPSVDTWRLASATCAAPTISVQPPNRVACLNGSAAFSITSQGSVPQSFQWQWKETGLIWRDLVEGDNADHDGVVRFSATGISMQSVSIHPSAAATSDLRRIAAVRCSVANGCGSIMSAPGSLRICAADYNCDSAVDFFDYLDFVSEFSSMSPAADFNVDGVVDFFDYLDFVAAFATGC